MPVNTATGLLLSESAIPGLPGIAQYADGGAAVRADETLLEELQQLRADAVRWKAVEAELMQLLGSTRADRILHDVRNILQERIFLLAACRDLDNP